MGHCRRRWPIINPAPANCPTFAGQPSAYVGFYVFPTLIHYDDKISNFMTNYRFILNVILWWTSAIKCNPFLFFILCPNHALYNVLNLVHSYSIIRLTPQLSPNFILHPNFIQSEFDFRRRGTNYIQMTMIRGTGFTLLCKPKGSNCLLPK